MIALTPLLATARGTRPATDTTGPLGRSASRPTGAGQPVRIYEGSICRQRSRRGDPGCSRRDTAAAIKSWRLATLVAAGLTGRLTG